jgi:hypothetical protein
MAVMRATRWEGRVAGWNLQGVRGGLARDWGRRGGHDGGDTVAASTPSTGLARRSGPRWPRLQKGTRTPSREPAFSPRPCFYFFPRSWYVTRLLQASHSLISSVLCYVVFGCVVFEREGIVAQDRGACLHQKQ